MARAALLLAALAFALGTAGPPARAGDAPGPAAPAALPADHVAAEAKALLPLLRSALKEDFRRQAWWLAGELLRTQPDQKEAKEALGRWKPEELALGRRPTKAWEQQRDAALAKVAEVWLQHVKEERAKGAAAADTAFALERALAFGAKSADAKAALSEAGLVWGGTWGALLRAEAEKALGDRADSVTWEPAREDDVLEVRALWPASRCARIGDWRLFTAGDLASAGHVLVLLAAQEQDFVARLGSKAKPPKDPDEDTATDVVLVPDAETYDRLAPLFFPQGRGPEPRWQGTSGFHETWRRRMVVLGRDRDNPWTPPDANLLAWTARALAKRHLAADASGWLTGRGAWIVDGLAALYEGFRLKDGAGDLDPSRAWHLAAARALKDRWIVFSRLVEMDRAAVEAEPRADVEIEFGGAKQKGAKVDVVLAQAAALVAGIARTPVAQNGGWPRVAALVEETYKRDRLPDLAKALGRAWRASLANAVVAADEAKGGE